MGDSFHTEFTTQLAEVNDVLMTRQTDKAIYIKTKDGKSVWIPKSKIVYLRKAEKTPEGRVIAVLHIPAWLAEKHGI